MSNKNPHLHSHPSFAHAVSLHIEHWRDALNDQLMIKGAPDEVSLIEHELKALHEIEQACAFELNYTNSDGNAVNQESQRSEGPSLLTQQQPIWDEFVAEIGTAETMQDVHIRVGRAEGYARCWLDNNLITAVAHHDLTVQLSSAAVARTGALNGFFK